MPDTETTEDSISPYTIHLWFPKYQGGYEYLLRHTKWREGVKTESGYVVEPIGESRDAGHKVLVEYSINHEYRDRHSWGYCPDKLLKMARLITQSLGGYIVAINAPNVPPNPDLAP